MTVTTLVLLGMLVAVIVIAARVWLAIRAAERRHRDLRDARDGRSRPPRPRDPS